MVICRDASVRELKRKINEKTRLQAAAKTKMAKVPYIIP
ncbi:hypothetical protein QY95_01683 [Bacillus thermotolerans]|uniref:Uncharacterized protein n=1 Tax=Bacillus thermotolerans TaxID=1221996 RepID=A0A0F5ID90_BACTR|nr:hypothetical protein QY95_01683 [Bacillus thermotolerans]